MVGHLWVIGQGHGWLAPAVRAALANAAQGRQFTTLAAAIVAAGQGAPVVDCVVVISDFPDQHSAADVASLRQALPLARLWHWVGPWCEGELRSGQPWPADVRWYSHQIATRLQSDQHAPRAAPLPACAAAEECLLAQPPPTRRTIPCGVAILATEVQAARWIADASRVGGYQARIVEPSSAAGSDSRPSTSAAGPGIAAAELVVCDLPGDPAMHQQPLERALALGPVIVLVNFPRPHEIARLLAQGAQTVLGKPCQVVDLIVCLDQARTGPFIASGQQATSLTEPTT